MTETVDDLIRRVETATGPDRELDVDLSAHFGGIFYQHPPWSTQTYVTPAPLTASVDAALALVGKVFPGCRYATGNGEQGPFCWIEPKGRGGTLTAHAATPALAILLALLRATRSTDA